jgi:hypothetical protein
MGKKQKNIIDDSVNNLHRLNCRLEFLKEVSNMEDQSDFSSQQIENYSYGKILMIEDMQSEINNVAEQLMETIR